MIEDLDRLKDALLERYGRVDILINNAGINIAMGALSDLSPETACVYGVLCGDQSCSGGADPSNGTGVGADEHPRQCDCPGDMPGTECMSDLGFTYKYQERIAQAALAIHECDKPVIAPNPENGVWMTKKGFWTNLDAPSLRHAILGNR